LVWNSLAAVEHVVEEVEERAAVRRPGVERHFPVLSLRAAQENAHRKMKKGPGIIAWLRARWRAARREDELERWAIGRARQFDMLHEYTAARRDGCSPMEALEEWDLL